jgi:hypothetical protein
VHWLTPAIRGTQEAETGRIMVRGQPGPKSNGTAKKKKKVYMIFKFWIC